MRRRIIIIVSVIAIIIIPEVKFDQKCSESPGIITIINFISNNVVHIMQKIGLRECNELSFGNRQIPQKLRILCDYYNKIQVLYITESMSAGNF